MREIDVILRIMGCIIYLINVCVISCVGVYEREMSYSGSWAVLFI